MKLTAILSLSGALALGVSASVLPPRQLEGTPRPGLLSIIALYTGDQCDNQSRWWAISTGAENPYLQSKKGCLMVDPTWNITSAKIVYSGEACTVSFYTDASCQDEAVTPELDECSTVSEANWKSYSIRGCTDLVEAGAA
ncbi:hypothetical protein B0H63DRAFT_527103 [Podospora didyma]|uniref:Secreted protein n=1 Tax=Podospora didyma TaxID=330526 RepID=A0AAE0K8T8_9PEZI|nr:hypothetical protein B0H63DRAFT_527103 [Podospora didyma]